MSASNNSNDSAATSQNDRWAGRNKQTSNLLAERTIRLAEDGNFILVNVLLNNGSHITWVSNRRHYSLATPYIAIKRQSITQISSLINSQRYTNTIQTGVAVLQLAEMVLSTTGYAPALLRRNLTATTSAYLRSRILHVEVISETVYLATPEM